MNNLKAKVICAGNCPVCNKPLKEDECIFICNECKIKNEIFMELEKLKAEIDEPVRDTTDSYGRGYACAMFKCLDILDKHISELKGEKNGNS